MFLLSIGACRGGDVTITGLKVQSVTAGTGSSPAPTQLKPRAAAFNGSLGFFTLGLSIEVLGLFELKRSVIRGPESTGRGLLYMPLTCSQILSS
jgi:hypothetical protein